MDLDQISEATWLTVADMAFQLGVDSSRVRHLLLQDQTRPVERRRFPSARKATNGEERQLYLMRRIGRAPAAGVWLITSSDVLRKEDPLLWGRPPNQKHSLAPLARVEKIVLTHHSACIVQIFA